MRQRAMIAMALANDPKLLIADEPTTALDVTVQAQILELIERLQSEFDTAVVVITHDLGVVAEMADEIAVMYAGRIVEKGNADTIFNAPEHPYTWGLLSSIPRMDAPRGEELVPIPGRPPSLINLPSGCSFHPRCPYVRDAHRRVEPTLEPRRRRSRPQGRLPARLRHAQEAVGRAAGGRQARGGAQGRHRGGRGMSDALVEVRDLVKHFPIRQGLLQRQVGAVRAVDGVSFDVAARRDARHGGRVGLRQVDHRAPAAAPDGADQRLDQVRRRGDRRHQGQAAEGPAARHADDLPGPVLVAEPAQDGRHDHRRAVRHPRPGQGRGRAQAHGPGADGPRRASTPSTTTATRTSSPAASASASASPARSRSSRR